MPTKTFVISCSCVDRPGIVAALSSRLAERGFNIEDSQQFDDVHTGQFFVRMVASGSEIDVADVRALLMPVIDQFGMTAQVREKNHRARLVVLVSKFEHCLADILYRWRSDELMIDVAAVISNHPRESLPRLNLTGVPFHYLPVRPDAKAEQEAEVLRIIDETGADLVVLARYMQILSNDLAASLSGRCINIHHSFLPGFKGAKPYHQAYERGVKMIGATAHYVTSDLDEGPIIIQDAEPISHRDDPEMLIRKGRDIERRVLTRAVRYHVEQRVLLNGSKTVVFPE